MSTPSLTTGRVLAAVVLFLTLGMAAQTWRVTSLQRQVLALELAPAKQATVSAAAKVETVTVKLAAAREIVTREITRVRTDTLMLHPVTREDTATALVQLPALAESHDSLQHACTAYVMTCDQFRVAAKAQRGTDSTYIVKLEETVKHEQPGRLAAIWGKSKVPIVAIISAYIGSKLR